MAAEVLPALAGLSPQNFLFAEGASIIARSSEANLFPASYIGVPYRKRRWRTTTSGSDATATFDFGSVQGNKLPTCLALVDSNLKSGATVELRLADYSDMTSAQLWTLTLGYDPGKSGVVRWFLGDPDSGTAAAHRFGQLKLVTGGTDADFFELGVLWLGDFIQAPTASGATVESNDPTKYSESYSGARYGSRLPQFHSGSISSQARSSTDNFTLMDLIDEQGSSLPMLVDLYTPSTDVAYKKHSAYYAYPPSNKTFSYTHKILSTLGDIKLDWDEARA